MENESTKLLGLPLRRVNGN